MSKVNETAPHLPTEQELAQAVKQRQRAATLRRMRQYSAEWISFFVLIAGSLLVLGEAWAKTKLMMARPPKFPFSVQYATVQDRTVDYSLEFPDDNGVPPAVRKIPKAERRLPYEVIGGEPGSTSFDQTFEPRTKKLDLVIPPKTPPGSWSGMLRLRDAQNRTLADMPVSFVVADPNRLWEVGLVGFALFTGVWYSFLVWRRPVPRGRLLMTDLLTSERNGDPSLAIKRIRRGWLRNLLVLPGRNRVRLRELHKRLPDGDIVYRRRGFFRRKERVTMDLKLHNLDATNLVLSSVWPTSTVTARQVPQRPQASIPIVPKARLWVITAEPDPEGKAISFTVEHPDKPIIRKN